MKLALKILLGVVAALVVVIGGVFAYVMTIDINNYRPEIIAQVKEATGRDIKLDGDLGLDISLTPSIVAKNVSFANAPWSSSPKMLELGELEANIQIMPILDDQIVIDKVVLKDVTVVLETNENGVGNWVMEPPTTSSTASSSSDSADNSTGSGDASGGVMVPVIGTIDIANVNLIYRDGVTGQSQNLNLKTLSLGGTDRQTLDVKLSALYQDIELAVTGNVGRPRLVLEGAQLPLDLTISADDAMITAKGKVTNPMQGQGADVALSVTIPDPALLVGKAMAGHPLSMPIPDLGALDFAAHLTQTGEMAGDLKDLSFSYGGIELEGEASGSGQTHSGSAQLTLKVEDPAALARTFAVDAVPALGPLNVTTSVTAEGPTEITIEQLAVAWGDIAAQLVAQLQLGDDLPGIDGTLKLDVPDVAKVAAEAGVDLPADVGALALSTKLKGEDKAYRATDLMLTLGATDLSGDIGVDLGKARPKLTVDVDSKLIDASPFLNPIMKGDAKQADATPAADPAPAETGGEASGDGRVIPNEPIDLAALKSADAEILLKAGTFKGSSIVTTDVVAKVSLENGHLKVEPFSTNAMNGSVKLELDLDSSEAVPTLKIDGDIKDFDIQTVTQQVTGLELGDFALANGLINVDTELTSSGGTPRELAAGLNGNFDFLVDKMTVTGIDLEPVFSGNIVDLMASGVAGVLNPEAETVFNCVVTRFDIKDGLMTDDGILIDISEGALKSEGTINLATEQLDMKVIMAPKNPQFASINPDLIVDGTFAKPEVAPSAESVITGLLGVAAAFTPVGPAAILGSMISTGSADENGCLKVVNASPEELEAAKQKAAEKNAKPVKQQQKPKAEDILKGILNKKTDGAEAPSNEQPQPAKPEDALKQLLEDENTQKAIGGALQGLFGN